MKRCLLLIAAVIIVLSVCACAVSKIEAPEARAWTKSNWLEADEKLKLAALTAVIGADRDDIDVEKSAEISLPGFDEYFKNLEDEALTLGEVYDLCTVQEITE